jgi:RHS repeat-associated protein
MKFKTPASKRSKTCTSRRRTAWRRPTPQAKRWPGGYIGGHVRHVEAAIQRLQSDIDGSMAGQPELHLDNQPLTGTRILSYAFDEYRPGAQSLNGTTVGNGNLYYTVSQDASTGRHTVRWEEYTSFNMPKEILLDSLVDSTPPVSSTVAERTLTFIYGPEHQRVGQIIKIAPGQPSSMQSGSIWYLNGEDSQGLSYEREVRPNGLTEHKHYLSAGGMVFALQVTRTLTSGTSTTAATATLSYFHHDHLGSIAAVSNAQGVVTERLAYDPWGKRRFASGLPDTLDSITGLATDRGYTMHEHLDEMGIIHMNGRVFDPLIGRFMSADPFIQAPGNLQSYNRYSYVMNNPLAYTDPSGFSLWTKFRDSVLKPVVAFVVGTAACGGNPYCGAAAAGAVRGYDQTHSFSGTLKGALNGLVSQFIGTQFPVYNANGSINWTNLAFNASAHAARGCAFSGGNCREGAVSSFVSAYLGPTLDKYVPFGEVGRLVSRGITGGLAAKAVGGRFSAGFDEGIFEGVTNALSVPATLIATGIVIAAIATMPEDRRQAIIDRVQGQLANLLERAKTAGGPQGVMYSLNATQSMDYPVLSSFTHPTGSELMSPGDVWKYGETTLPDIRYASEQPAAGLLGQGLLNMERLHTGPQIQMKVYEKRYLL